MVKETDQNHMDAPITVATDELLCLKNAGAQISTFFTSNEKSAPMAVEKMQILGAVLEYPLNSTANLAHLAHFCGKWAGLAVLFCR